MKQLSLVCVSILISLLLIWALAQDRGAPSTVDELIRSAIERMDSGDTEGALADLEAAKKMDPTDYSIYYEMGYAYMLDEDYKRAAKHFKLATMQEVTTGQSWQMLGNTYDYMGKPKKAVKTYVKGLEQFPEFGGLYVELGVMAAKTDNYDLAIEIWEEGVRSAPKYPGNYHRLTTTFAASDQPLWSLFYGEILRHIEPSTKRSEAIAEVVFEVYKENLTVKENEEGEIEGNVSLYSSPMELNISMDMLEDTASIGEAIMKLTSSFHMDVEALMGTALVLSLEEEKELDLASLSRIRSGFINAWYENGREESHPNILFKYWKKVEDAGHMEAYTHWVFQTANEGEFRDWLRENEEKFEAFDRWFQKYQIRPNESRLFFRPDQE